MKPVTDSVAILGALHFAAHRHRDQRRKGEEASPYINHPIEVAELLARVGGVTDMVTLQAAILHDTLEDTQTTREELGAVFGPEVLSVVEEVTDDKSLPKAERKRLQIEHAPYLSERARLIKLADKISNVRAIVDTPPSGWTLERRLEYLDWTERVIAGCRGCSAPLERYYDEALARGRSCLAASPA
jgi:(p)ppGpp synthase/HD superfamily hydrolase